MIYEGNQRVSDTGSSRSVANNIPSKGKSMPAVPVMAGPSNAGVIQMKEPFDGQGEEKWDEVVENIRKASHYELSEKEVKKYLTDELYITAPEDLDLDGDAELGEYVSELERIKVGEVAHTLMEAQRALELKKQWTYHESLDESPTRDEAEDRYYSSEEDEATGDEDKFKKIVDVIIHLNSQLEEYLDDAPETGQFKKAAQSVVDTIVSVRGGDKKKAIPTDKVPIVPIAGGRDWAGFGKAFHEAKDTKGQKPTVYNLEYSIWPGAVNKKIGFKGRQLKDAHGGAGRSWPAIAMALNQLAIQLGQLFMGTAEGHAAAGTRILASAMLAILGGRGGEVKEHLHSAGLKNLDAFEAVVLEFFALTMGIESIRMAFSQLDVVLHLNNIARGRTVGETDKRYDFLNVFSPIRSTKKGTRHVYAHAQYVWHRRRDPEEYDSVPEHQVIDDIADETTDMEIKKELTPYQGFNTAPVAESQQRPKERGEIKSAKSSGKSSFSHSAGHTKTEKLFRNHKETRDLLWQQIQTVAPKKRREAHEMRLFSMGPIRVYNLLAGILKKYEAETAEMPSKLIASYLLELYTNFINGVQPGSDNPFYREFPSVGGGDFGFQVKDILQSEKTKKLDQSFVDAFTQAMEMATDANGLPKFSSHEQMEEMILHLLRTGYHTKKGNTLLHEAVRLGLVDWIFLLVQAGADLQAENKQGETPLALAIRLKQEKVAQIIVHVQDKQKEKQKDQRQLPKEWQAFATGKKPEGGDWLTDNEVRALLLEQDLPNTYITPAVDIAHNPDVLATFIRENYLAQLAQGYVELYTVVPINFNNAHWTTLVIVQNTARRSQPTIYFFDSLGNDDEKVKLIKMMLQMTGVYTRADNIHDLSLWLQDDGYTCGTWMVQAASTIVNSLEKGALPREIEEALRRLQGSIEALHAEATGREDRKKEGK